MVRLRPPVVPDAPVEEHRVASAHTDADRVCSAGRPGGHPSRDASRMQGRSATLISATFSLKTYYKILYLALDSTIELEIIINNKINNKLIIIKIS